MNHVRSRVDLQYYDVKRKRFSNFFDSLLPSVEKATKIHYNSCDPITLINLAGICDDLYTSKSYGKKLISKQLGSTTNSAIKAYLQHDTYIGEVDITSEWGKW